MNDKSLDDWLRAVGQTVQWRGGPRPRLAQQVLRLHARRRHTRRAVGGFAAVVLLVGGAVWAGLSWTRTTPQAKLAVPRPPEAGQQIERLRAELARLDAEARQRHQAAMQLLDAHQRRERAAQSQHDVEPGAVGVVEGELEKAAFLMVDYAQERVARGQGDLAAAEYRRVLRVFPKTGAAETARKSLTKISPEKGDL
jgi:hypothetical protein